MTAEVVTVAADAKTTAAEETQDLDQKIIRQIEYYFGDYNLPRDKFLQEEIKKDDGWIALETMLKFKRLATLSTDSEVICEALKKATGKIMEIHESKEKIRRDPARPLPVYNDEMKEETVKKTVYVKGFPKNSTLDELLEFFKKYGPYETVLMRYFHDKEKDTHGFKGSVFVVFPSVEKATEFRETDEVRYKETLLLKQWQSEYLAAKLKEMEERKALKEARKKKAEEEAKKDEGKIGELPKGMFVHFSGIEKGSTISREDVKAALDDMAEQCVFIDYSKGLTEGFMRFNEAEFNKKVLEKTEGKIKVAETEVILRTVEGEEEEAQLKKYMEAQRMIRSRNSGGGNRKRKMGNREGFIKRRKY